ncbi:hypothetical protein B0T26DRAFT_671070 [Lasiosphaeria miniovina]|uniref:Beta-lactamase-related domain-containing protein n=1 Tax=Lasiosphaeria miniovina TaxID=1954250 RepID=A0AA40EGN4_9PEZI|nr:uncharacterized protein B0T26DRAFT_671070 [Lasiosphaeria miniovina]KAK0734838.1 hypothetical protein B0T26DRAFT_671070 [Lasiosphaeria miniovina]
MFSRLGPLHTSLGVVPKKNEVFPDLIGVEKIPKQNHSGVLTQMPTLTPGNEAKLVLQHGGSLAGYTTFLSIIPELNVSVVALVNSIGLGDPAGWIHQLVLEAIIETKKPNDHVALAEEAALSHANSIAEIPTDLQKARKDIPLQRPLSDFTGLY